MNRSPIGSDFEARLKEVESRWSASFDLLLSQLNDIERSDYYRRFRLATELMREYANFVTKKERYFVTWVGGEFNLALAVIGVVGVVGFGLSFFHWFAVVLNFVESRSVFLTLIALAVALGWLHHTIEVETRRASYEVQVARYVFEWRSLGLTYVLLHDSRYWMDLDEREERGLSDKELRDRQVMLVKTLCEVRETLILDILGQRNCDTTEYLLKSNWLEFNDLIKSDAT
jgi:hypothetical protein